MKGGKKQKKKKDKRKKKEMKRRRRRRRRRRSRRLVSQSDLALKLNMTWGWTGAGETIKQVSLPRDYWPWSKHCYRHVQPMKSFLELELRYFFNHSFLGHRFPWRTHWPCSSGNDLNSFIWLQLVSYFDALGNSDEKVEPAKLSAVYTFSYVHSLEAKFRTWS